MNKKRKFNLVVIMGVLFSFVFLVASPVLAYSLATWGFYGKDVPINTVGVHSAYATPLNNAINNWNFHNSIGAIPRKIIVGGAFNNRAITDYFGMDWFGYYGIRKTDNSYYPHTTTEFYLLLNRDLLDVESATFKQSVAAHEFGHAFGLADLSSGTAIMNIKRNRNTLYTAQPDDINGVKASWNR